MPLDHRIVSLCERLEYVGSRVTCNPPPVGTDQDILVLATGWRWTALVVFLNTYWHRGGSAEEPTTLGSSFISYRNGEINVIATNQQEFFDLFMEATHICKAFNVAPKTTRVAAFEAIMHMKSLHKAVSVILLQRS